MNIRPTRSFMLGALLLLPGVLQAQQPGDRERRPLVAAAGSSHHPGWSRSGIGQFHRRGRPRHHLRRRLGPREVPALSRSPQRRNGRRVPLLERDRPTPVHRAGRSRRLPRSALLRVLQQLRQDQGVVRVESDPAVLQPGHGDALHDRRSRCAAARRWHPDRAAERDDHAGRRGGPGAALRSAHPPRRVRSEADV